MFILAGKALAESIRDDVRMTAPLNAISAAVLGVIVSLAVFFGQHAFVQAGRAAAGVTLLHYRIGAIPMIIARALAGLVLSYRHG